MPWLLANWQLLITIRPLTLGLYKSAYMALQPIQMSLVILLANQQMFVLAIVPASTFILLLYIGLPGTIVPLGWFGPTSLNLFQIVIILRDWPRSWFFTIYLIIFLRLKELMRFYHIFIHFEVYLNRRMLLMILLFIFWQLIHSTLISIDLSLHFLWY